MVEIVETPRDAMQGMGRFIPTEKKIELINLLLNVGFDIIDFGSFVSPKSIPQFSDTAQVVERLDLSGTSTRLLAIIGNTRGAIDACNYNQIALLGYPHSISDEFLKRNINSSLRNSRKVVNEIQDIALKYNKVVNVYISMAFGNPYNQEWHLGQLLEECEILNSMGITRVALSDTIGAAAPEQIGMVFLMLNKQFPLIKFGLHLHTAKRCWLHLIDQAYKNGCRSFDGGIGGLGGCPLTGFEMVENLKTRYLLWYLDKNNIRHNINKTLFDKAEMNATQIFSGTY